MGRKSLKESRQKEIILAFYQVAKKAGLENTSIAKVADHLDINPCLVINAYSYTDIPALTVNLIWMFIAVASMIRVFHASKKSNVKPLH